MSILNQYIDKFKDKISKKDNKMEFVRPQKEKMRYDAVNIDTNNTCNQRCRFCFTPFDEKPVNMDLDTFKAVLKVLPLVKDQAIGGFGFYFSCIYEPTINPLFIECLNCYLQLLKINVF